VIRKRTHIALLLHLIFLTSYAQVDTVFVSNDTLCPSSPLDSAQMVISMASGNANYSFDWIFNTNGLSTTSGDTVMAFPTQSTTYIIKATNNSTSFYTILYVDIHVEDLVSAGIGDTIMVCQNEQPLSLLTALTGQSADTGTWLFNGNPTDSLFDPQTDPPGTYSYVLHHPVCGNDTVSIYCGLLNPPSTTAALNPIYITSPATGLINTSTSGGSFPYTYQWSPSTFLLNTTVADPIYSNATTSIPYTLLTTASNGCSDLDTIILSVAGAVLNISSPQTSFSGCYGFMDTLDVTVTGGSGQYSFDWSPGHLVSDSTIEDPVVVATDTFDIQLIVTDHLGNQDTISFHVSPYPNVPIGFSPVVTSCEGWAGFQIQASVFPPNGTFTGPGITSQGYFNPSAPGPGQHTLTYTYIDPYGCVYDTSQTITVLPRPSISITPIPSVCNTGSSVDLSNFVFPSGGSFTGAGISNGSYFDPQLFGNTTNIGLQYTYIDSNNCSKTVSTSIQVIDVNSASLSLSNTQICSNGAPYFLTGGNPFGGMYTGPGVNNGYLDPVQAGPGLHEIHYIYGDTSACYSEASAFITVVDTPNITFAGDSIFCLNEPGQVLNLAIPLGGSYTGTGVISNVFYPDSAGVGTHDIQYTVLGVNGCSAQKTIPFVVYELPLLSGTLDTNSVCINAGSLALSGITPGGGVYSGNSVLNNIFYPSSAGAGQYSVLYNYVDTNGCQVDTSMDLTVYSSPSVSIPPIGSICQNGNPLVLDMGLPSGGIFSGLNVSGGLFYPDSAGLGLHQISYAYTDTFGCSGSAVQTIFVQSSPNITGTPPSQICASDDPILLGFAQPGPGQYSGLAVNNGFFDPDLAGGGTHSVTYEVTLANGCSDSTIFEILVNDDPMVSLGLFPDHCINQGNIQLVGGQPLGGVFLGPFISDTTFFVNQAGAGTHTISYAYVDTNGCTDTAFQSLLLVDLLPTSFSSIPNMCIHDSAVVLSGGSPANGYYFGNGVNNGYFHPNIAGIGAHQIGYTLFDTLNCVDTSYVNVQIFPRPYLIIDTVSALCLNDTAIGIDPVFPSGGIYSGPGVLSNGQFDPWLAGVGLHSIDYHFEDNMGCVRDTSFEVTVHPLPQVNLGVTDSICESADPLFLTQGSPSGGYYTGIGVWNDSLYPAYIGVGYHDIFYHVSDSNGCWNSTTNMAIVHADPPIPIIDYVSGTMICNWGFYSYQWFLNGAPIPGGTEQIYQPTQDGSYHVVITNSYGCSSSSGPFLYPDMVGLDEMERHIRIYPNPATDRIFIEWPFEQISRLEIYDLQGQSIKLGIDRSETQIILDTSTLNSGTYILDLGEFGKKEIIILR
jgi:hypothetical protein